MKRVKLFFFPISCAENTLRTNVYWYWHIPGRVILMSRHPTSFSLNLSIILHLLSFRNIRPIINQWKQSFQNQCNLEHQSTWSLVTHGFKPSIFFFFQAKDVSIVVVGVGKNFPEKESNLKDIAGSKGKTLRYGNFDALSGKVDEILNEMCGKAFAFLFFFMLFFS